MPYQVNGMLGKYLLKIKISIMTLYLVIKLPYLPVKNSYHVLDTSLKEFVYIISSLLKNPFYRRKELS